MPDMESKGPETEPDPVPAAGTTGVASSQGTTAETAPAETAAPAGVARPDAAGSDQAAAEFGPPVGGQGKLDNQTRMLTRDLKDKDERGVRQELEGHGDREGIPGADGEGHSHNDAYTHGQRVQNIAKTGEAGGWEEAADRVQQVQDSWKDQPKKKPPRYREAADDDEG